MKDNLLIARLQFFVSSDLRQNCKTAARSVPLYGSLIEVLRETPRYIIAVIFKGLEGSPVLGPYNPRSVKLLGRIGVESQSAALFNRATY